MEIVIRNFTSNDLSSLNELLNEAYNLVKKDSSCVNTQLVAVYNDKVVGYLVINKLYDDVLGCNYCYVNYVCVKSEYRNCGIATKLFEKVFEICKSDNVSYIELTSNPTRIEAHKLYDKLGFKIRETNVFRKEII